MSYPVGWDLVNVTGTYIGKNGVPCVGSVTFSSPQLVVRSGTIVPAADIVFDLVNGTFSGQIPATDDPNANPVGWVYTVTENVPGGRQGYQIVAPHTSPGIDLSTVVPVTMPMPPTFGFPYVTQAQLAAPGGSALIDFVQAGTGAVPLTAQAKMRQWTSPLDFGAKYDGTTDDTTAHQDALNYLASIGGGILICPSGKTVISATLTITTSGVSMYGQGRGQFNDSGTQAVAPTQFQWAGAAGIPMVSVAPGGTQALASCSVADIQFLGNGANMASHGVLVSSCRQSTHRISGAHFSTAVLMYTIASGLTEASDCQNNDIWVLGYQEATGEGSIFICDSPTVGSGTQGNFSLNRVWEATGNHYNAVAHIIKGADNNDFYSMTAYRITGGSATVGISLTDSTSRGSNANVLWHASTNAGVSTTQTTYPSTNNNIVFYDIENGSPTPSIGTGCTLWWGSNHGSTGVRSSTPGTNYNQIVYPDGRTRYSNNTSAISAGGNLVITFPTAFTTAALSASCTPIQYSASPAITCGISVTTTSITIFNTSANPSSFWWSVEGY